MNVQLWKDETKKLFWGFIAMIVFSVITAILPLVSVDIAAAVIAKHLGVMSAYTVIVPLIALCIYVFLYLSANKLAKGIEGAAGKGFKLVAVSFCLTAVAQLISFIPYAGWILVGLIGLVAAILMMIGFADIKGDEKVSLTARGGANFLFIASILALVAAVFAFIPAVGGILALIISLVAFVLEILGWVRLQKIEE